MNHHRLTVYTTPGCIQCTLTLKALDHAGIPYQLINLAEDPIALQHIKAAGFRHAPIVEGAGETWAGFRPDRISQLVKTRAL